MSRRHIFFHHNQPESFMKFPLIKASAVILFALISTTAVGQQSTEGIISNYLSDEHQNLGLKNSDVQNYVITDETFSKRSGVKHVYLAQTINGTIVKNGVANLAINSENEVVHFGNRFVSDLQNKIKGATEPAITADQAIAFAQTATGLDGRHGELLRVTENGRSVYDKGTLSKEEIVVYTAFWNVKDEVKLVWIVSLYQLDGAHWWQSFIDAATGEEIDRIDWVVSCQFPDHDHAAGGCSHNANEPIESTQKAAPLPGGPASYNVFAWPVESPNHGLRTIEFDPADALASPFGWHDNNGVFGEEFTITRGNNVYAYDDIADSNTPGSSPDGGSALVFDYPYSGANSSNVNLNAAITNLFYWNNIMHDVYYQYGFDEISGNFQDNNYGNGGNDDDYVLAEAQDGSGTNNANFATPEDGFNPRMQMYLWTGGTSLGSFLDVNSPAPIAGSYNSTEATFGPGLPATPITADIVLATDGTAPVNDACETITNGAQMNGKIAMIDRGDCTFALKVENAQAAGAVAVIIVNNVAGSPIQMGGTSNTVTIPSIMISQNDGDEIKAQLLNGAVNGTISNGGAANQFRDSDFDNGIIAHEYGHGISNRLTGGPSNSNCLQNAEQMGEGWSDWLGLMLTIESGDLGPDPRGVGTYAAGQSTTATGIRPAAYSTDFGVNPYTYGNSNDAGNISQPHGVGFIYATVLWDLTWALIDNYGGVPDPDIYGGSGGNNIAMALVIESMKLQPCGPGMIDGRDAILAADQLLYGGLHQCIIWNAFANRGFGFSASQGSSNSRTDQVEAFDLPQSCLTPTVAPSAAFTASSYNTCDPEVSFEDNSTNVPQQWDWDFGDGGTSTLPNPTHVFASEGTFTVQLTVTNTVGSNTTTQQVTIDLPDEPIVDDETICVGDNANLIANSTGTSVWRDNSNTIVQEGDTLQVVNVTSAQTFTVENVVAFPLGNVGPVNSNFGTGGYHNTGYHGALNFTAQQGFEIVSAWVDADGAGTRTISLASGTNSTGDVPAQTIEQITVDLVDGPQVVDLNIIVPAAGDYNIGGNNVGLYRNDTGPNYPYTLPGVMTINSSSAGTSPFDFYYYFYNIEVREIPCISLPVNVTVSPVSADFSYVDNSGTVSFTDLSTNATSWFWEFGDGNTSTLQNPVHTYANGGSYTATLTINGLADCSADELIDALVGINDLQNGQLDLQLVPNPANTDVMVRFADIEANSVLSVYASDGRLISSQQLPRGTQNATISVNELANAMYWVVLNAEGQSPMRSKLMVAH